MKRIVSSLAASLLALTTVSAVAPMNFDASATSTDPNMYVNIVALSDGRYRADVMLENAPSFNNGGIHIILGSSWEASTHVVGNHEVIDKNTDSTLHENSNLTSYHFNNTDDIKSVSVVFGCDNSYNHDYNGRFISFYIKKTNNYDEDNNTINLEPAGSSIPSTLNQNLASGGSVNLYPTVMNTSEIMLDATEYLRGDVSNDLTIDSSDASLIYAAVGNNTYSVDSLKYTYTSMFPNAKCVAVMDANEDGFINADDGGVILDYYADILNGCTPTSNVGQIDVYEIYS